MKSEYILEKFDSGMHFIELDAAIVKKFTKNGNKRVICTLNKSVQFHCAIMSRKEGGHYINIGLSICKKLKIKRGSVVRAQFSLDESKYQFEVPEEFTEVLESDPDAKKAFEALSPGNQRGLIYLVTLVKSTDKKIERSLTIAEKIKNGIVSPRLILKK